LVEYDSLKSIIKFLPFSLRINSNRSLGLQGLGCRESLQNGSDGVDDRRSFKRWDLNDLLGTPREKKT